MSIFRWRSSNRRQPAPAPEPTSFVDANSSVIHAAGRQIAATRRQIEVVIDDTEIERRLMERVVSQWQKLGSAEPFWSNCTVDVYRNESLDDGKKQQFYRRGDGTLELLDAFESRSGVRISDGTCLDFGCGVGRIIEPLSRRFRQVIGVDVSSALLDHCDVRAKQIGASNVKTVLLTDVDVLKSLGPLDLFFSISVLQHNPPPVQRAILRNAFSILKPGGFCLFQTPDWLDGYTFACTDFLENAPDKNFDLHCLPKQDVLKILLDNSMQLLDFAPDFELAQFGSYVYFAQKVA